MFEFGNVLSVMKCSSDQISENLSVSNQLSMEDVEEEPPILIILIFLKFVLQCASLHCHARK